MAERVVIFDFDGVMLHGAGEHALVAFNTISGKFARRLDELPPVYLDLFLLNRCRITSAANLVGLGRWCLEHLDTTPRLLSRKEAAQILEMPHHEAKELENRFFAARTRLMETDSSYWFELNRPVQPLWEELRRWHAGSLLILTTKNARAILDLCKHYDFPMTADRVYSGDHKTTKEENAERILQRFHRSSYVFIDDAVNNLIAVEPVFSRQGEYKPILARWGYTSPEDIAVAREKHFQVAEQVDVIALLKDLTA